MTAYDEHKGSTITSLMDMVTHLLPDPYARRLVQSALEFAYCDGVATGVRDTAKALAQVNVERTEVGR